MDKLGENMQMEREEFLRLAKETFGDKISVSALSIPEGTLDKLNKRWGTELSEQDISSYGEHAWLIGNECPRCEESLVGIFGCFQWGIVHGEGHCFNCDDIAFRLYHYVSEGAKPLQLFSVVGF